MRYINMQSTLVTKPTVGTGASTRTLVLVFTTKFVYGFTAEAMKIAAEPRVITNGQADGFTVLAVAGSFVIERLMITGFSIEGQIGATNVTLTIGTIIEMWR